MIVNGCDVDFIVLELIMELVVIYLDGVECYWV